ncbi:MAG: NYN domain-containing protein [Chloroflexi bacterium]|nr:NYN domain-containing protein [Chloroflexota bacterium]
MALNFLTGSRTSEEEAPEANETETTTTNTTDEDESPAPARRRRRGTRGGRSSAAKTAAAAEAETTEEEPPAPRRASSRRRASEDDEEAAPARPSRRRAPARASSDEDEDAPAPRPSRRRAPARATSDEDEDAPAPRPSRRRAPAARASEDDDAPPRPTRRRAPAAKASDQEPEKEAPKRAAPRRRSRPAAEDNGADAALLDALKEQTEQLARLVELQERAIDRLSGNGKAGVGTIPRVGVFVDSANVELARDRTRGGRPIDWGLVLDRVTEGRRLVRAIAYSPVHDDPGVSRETQRFVEPFLGKGFKIVTKPLKRFADGSIKANVDIELALDVITMADRLDVAVLASGDGDFQHLVEVLQSRGIRVEVAGLGQSVAGNLKRAADHYIELDFAQKKK